jgi:hypothetical protein
MTKSIKNKNFMLTYVALKDFENYCYVRIDILERLICADNKCYQPHKENKEIKLIPEMMNLIRL